ncbi:uncharacterized protein LOC106875520 [Octopus bimaculoides]|uniref:uncharacterized protein LOC106875520 n=1 Tax=Octopus bimaculoides TaxID=37653 RepID=UPI00071DFAC7|nr:uncharacterized protein LOC106875520 [Octopus bimaculoides]|eukprot:XP_014779193.1 PREDICTED: uncharacterized protein LOC106875520 [Octopus bimaculoides]
MKSIVFLCFALFGAVLSDKKCEDEAKEKCLDAMGTYPKVDTIKKMCSRLSMIRSCMDHIESECYEYFDADYERKCLKVDLPEHSCVADAEKNCGDAMGTYPTIPSTLKFCHRLHMFRSCMQPKNTVCHDFFRDLIEKQCSIGVLYRP